ncbi:MAG: TetR/AcrR family transcriptional regulator [Myxococcota bacterium]
MSKRKIDPEGARTAILEAALDLFAEQGFHNTSIKQIADRAEVTKSLIHHHFGNKDNLWAAIVRDMLDTYFQAQRALLMKKQINCSVMRESMELYFNYFRKNPQLPRLMAWMSLEKRTSFEDMSEGLVEFAIQRVHDGQRNGAIRDDLDPYFVMVAFFMLLEPWFGQREMMSKKFDIGLTDEEMDDRWIHTAALIMTRGLEPREPHEDDQQHRRVTRNPNQGK